MAIFAGLISKDAESRDRAASLCCIPGGNAEPQWQSKALGSAVFSATNDPFCQGTVLLVGELGPNDPATLVESWNTQGRRCVEALIGAFAFALWDEDSQTFFAARDRFGIIPFCYAQTDDFLAFAALPSQLVASGLIRRTLNHTMIGEYLVSVWDAPNLPSQTFYQEIHRLPPANSLTMKGAAPTIQEYWRLDSDFTVELPDDGAYIEQFRDMFIAAVDSQMQQRTGAALSGGLDSSAICGVMRKLKPDDPIDAFFTRSPLPENDESEWVHPVVEQHRLSLHVLPTHTPMHQADRLLELLAEPFSYDNLDQDWTMIQAAGDAGVDVLLSGFYGDAALSITHDYMLDAALSHDWQALLHQAEQASATTGSDLASYFWEFGAPRLEQLAAGLHWADFVREGRIAAGLFGVPWSQVLWHLWLRPLMPKALRRVYREVTSAQCPVWYEFNRLINPDFAEFIGLQTRARQLKQGWTAPVNDAREAHHAHLNHGTRALALEQQYGLGAASGVTPAYPFLNRELIEFCYGIPRKLHGRDGWDRWIMRKAMEGLLPDAVRWRKKKTEYSATVTAGRHKDLELMREIVSGNRGRLGEYINLQKLDEEFDWYAEQTENNLETIKSGHLLWRATLLARWLSLQ